MNSLNLPYRVPLALVVEVYREEGLALKWISRPQPRRRNETVTTQQTKPQQEIAS